MILHHTAMKTENLRRDGPHRDSAPGPVTTVHGVRRRRGTDRRALCCPITSWTFARERSAEAVVQANAGDMEIHFGELRSI